MLRVSVITPPGLSSKPSSKSELDRRTNAIEYPPRSTEFTPRNRLIHLFSNLGLHAKPRLGAKFVHWVSYVDAPGFSGKNSVCLPVNTPGLKRLPGPEIP